MLCLEIKINGEKKGLIGHEGADEFGVSVSTNPLLNKEICLISANGGHPSDDIYSDELKWFKSSVKVGDIVSIKVIESDNPDTPTITKYKEGVIEQCTYTMLCSNCGSSRFETGKFVSSGKVSLCEECVVLFADIISE